MKMSLFWWTILPILTAAFAQVKSQSTAYPVIPKHLLECYLDDGIYHRANRMPSTLDSFLDLLRKVEGSPTSRNLNARELAMVLLHYVKLDGIQYISSDVKHFPKDIIPFSPSGSEYFKHRLILVGLVPKIDSSYQTAFNETLSTREMCNLHFMLSYSIEPYKRADERCHTQFEEYGRGTRTEPRSTWDPYHTHLVGRRHRRHISRGEQVNEVRVTNAKAVSKQISKTTDTKDSNEMVKKLVSGDSIEISKYFTKHEINGRTNPRESKRTLHRRSTSIGQRDKKSEVEEIPTAQNLNVDKKPFLEDKDKFTIGDQELLSADVSRPQAGIQSLVQGGTFGKHGRRIHPKPMQSVDDRSGVIQEAQLSDCPIVNGVITTPFGSLTVGTVIAGIAAGLNPEDIPPRRLSVEAEELESPSDRIKNIWGATLAGTVADIISSSAILDQNNLEILKGGWNDSFNAKWYLLSTNKFRHLPEVTLRGSLDGLFLGLNAKEWTARFQGLKLSQMLQIFYGCCWGTVGAKHRLQLRPQYADDEIFRKQTHLMSLVMKKQKTNDFTVLNYNYITREAVGKVIQHIQTMDQNEKSYIGTFLSTQIDNSVNMIAVIDSSWGYENLNKIFENLRAAQVVNVISSNLTIVCGKDGRVLLSSENSADFYNRFTKELLFENCTRGMDLPLIFDVLDTMYRKIFHDEKMSQKMNTDAQVTVLFPYESLPRENSYVKEKSCNFRRTFPDVRLMIATNGASESFLELVDDPKELFPLLAYPSENNWKYYKELSEGAKQSKTSPESGYQRISRPSCGSYFDDNSQGTETRVTKDVGIGNIAYYRLSPQYFYTQHEQATITIKSMLKSPLTVCHSRKMKRPLGPTPRGNTDYNPNRIPDYSPDFPPEASPYGRQTNVDDDEQVQCKTITTDSYKIEMNDPCKGATNLRECDPLYISLSPPHQDAVSIVCLTCRLPTNVQFEILASGLTCYNSATINYIRKCHRRKAPGRNEYTREDSGTDAGTREKMLLLARILSGPKSICDSQGILAKRQCHTHNPHYEPDGQVHLEKEPAKTGNFATKHDSSKSFIPETNNRIYCVIF